MQRQLDKITNLLRLIVQKMEITTEIELDDRSKCDQPKECMSIQKLRQVVNVKSRFSHLRSFANTHN